MFVLLFCLLLDFLRFFCECQLQIRLIQVILRVFNRSIYVGLDICSIREPSTQGWSLMFFAFNSQLAA